MPGQFPSELIDRIRDSNDIVSVISEYVSLKKVGNRFTGLCPFHAEKTPSFSVSRDRQLFYCFGCHAAGNVYTFLQKIENISFTEAVMRLGNRAGIDVAKMVETDEERAARERRELIYRVNKFAQRYYRQFLLGASQAQCGRDYLDKRGMSPESQEGFGLGFSPNGWDVFVSAALAKGISSKALLEAGLALKADSDGQLRDRFRNRVMFPIFDVYGNVIGFGGRNMDSSHPKYLNSSETPVFSKRMNLYGINLALSDIRNQGCAVIVEGYMDVISAHQGGVKNVVASLGTALTHEQGRLLSRYCRKVILCYDADTAGRNAAMKGIDVMRSAGLEVRIVVLPDGEDPDSLVRNRGGDAFKELVSKSVPYSRFQIDSVMSRFNMDTVEDRLNALKELVPVLSRIESETERMEYIREISGKLFLDPEAITSDVQKHRRGITKEFIGNNKSVESQNILVAKLTEQSKNSALIEAEKSLLRQAVVDKPHFDVVCDALNGIEMTGEENRAIFEEISSVYKEGGTVEITSLIDRVDLKYRDYTTALFVATVPEGASKNILEDAVRGWNRVYTKCRLRELDHLIARAESAGDLDTLTELMREQQKVRDKLGKDAVLY